MIDFSSLEPVAFTVSPNILWIVFCLAIIVFSIMSFIYIYHWRNYGTGNATITHIEIVYVIVGLVFISLSALFISMH